MTKSPISKRSTIGNDPFASVIPLPTDLGMVDLPVAAPATNVEPAKTITPRKPKVVNGDQPTEVVTKTAVKKGKQKLTVHLSPELAERVKNAAYWNPKLTIAGIAEQGIKQAIEKYERENGGPYPTREQDLVGGRPIK